MRICFETLDISCKIKNYLEIGKRYCRMAGQNFYIVGIMPIWGKGWIELEKLWNYAETLSLLDTLLFKSFSLIRVLGNIWILPSSVKTERFQQKGKILVRKASRTCPKTPIARTARQTFWHVAQVKRIKLFGRKGT